MTSKQLDLNYICGNNQDKVSYFVEQDISLDDLLNYSKDLFELLDELNLSKRDLCEFLLKLKVAHDFKKGKPVSDLLLYESDRESPVRLSVEDRLRSLTYFFKLIPGQEQAEKSRIQYSCESCANPTALTILDVKDHVRDWH
jgi:hypothetical protein